VKRAALLLVVVAAARAAPAAARAPLILVVQTDAAKRVPPVELAERLERDLSIPVLVQSTPNKAARGVLTITWDERGRRLLLTYHDGCGDEMSRVLGDAPEHRTSVDMIALVAANLVRNETDELLAELAHQRSSAEPPDRDTSEVVLKLAADSSSTDNVVVTRPRTRPSSRATTHPWSFGTLTYLSSRSAEPVYSPGNGFYVSRTFSKHFSLGLTDIMVLPNEGQTVLSGGPYAEGFWFARDWLQLFGQLAIPLQGRWGSGRSAFGAQPFFAGGLRFWIGGRVSIAAAVRVAVVASSAFAAPPTELVQGTVSAGGGLELGFHL
jgi:hypothetical protein